MPSTWEPSFSALFRVDAVKSLKALISSTRTSPAAAKILNQEPTVLVEEPLRCDYKQDRRIVTSML